MLSKLLRLAPLLGLLMLPAGPAAAQTSVALAEPLRGDVNLDGDITALDALAVLTTLVGKTLPSGYNTLPYGDADGNGRLSALDALVILAYTVDKKTQQYPVGKTIVRVSVTPSPVALAVGQTQELRATFRGNKIASVTWRSAAPAVATVDAQGVVKAIAPGSTIVTAIAQADTMSRTEVPVSVSAVAVAPVAVATVSVSPTPVVLSSIGATQQLQALAKDADGQVVQAEDIVWTSSSAAIVEVSATGVVTARANGSAVITATTGGTSGTVQVEVKQAVATVVLDLTQVDLTVGQAAQLVAKVLDANGNAVIGATVAWSSSNTAAASVSANGLVTGLAAGSATILAAAGDRSTSVSATISEPLVASVAVSPTSHSFSAIGQKVSASATGLDAQGSALRSQSVSWSSSDPAVAAVSSTGEISAVSNGSATITATISGKSGTVQVAMQQVPTSVQVSPSTATLNALGESVQLSLTALDANGNSIANCAHEWSSLSPEIATVSNLGTVLSKAVGIALITASCSGVTDTVSVDVSQQVSSVAVSPGSASAQVGGNVQLSATAKDANGSAVSGATFRWTSSDTMVATVDELGVVKGVGAGSTTITARSGEKSGGAELTVQAVSGTAPGAEAGRNEPAGFTTLIGRRFNSVSTYMGNDGTGSYPFMVGGSEGFDNIEYRGVSKGTIALDATQSDAPLSRESVVRLAYTPEGVAEANATGNSYSPGVIQTYGWAQSSMYPKYGGRNHSFTRMYVRTAVKVSENWQGHSAGTNKLWYNRTTGPAQPYVRLQGARSNPLALQVSLSGTPQEARPIVANVAGTSVNANNVVRGQWYEIELYMQINSAFGVPDGVLKVWLNGELVMNYSDIDYRKTSDPMFWNVFHGNAVWGGGSGDTLNQTQYIWFDDVYVSGAN